MTKKEPLTTSMVLHHNNPVLTQTPKGHLVLAVLVDSMDLVLVLDLVALVLKRTFLNSSLVAHSEGEVEAGDLDSGRAFGVMTLKQV